jgi:hypothetical protein
MIQCHRRRHNIPPTVMIEQSFLVFVAKLKHGLHSRFTPIAMHLLFRKLAQMTSRRTWPLGLRSGPWSDTQGPSRRIHHESRFTVVTISESISPRALTGLTLRRSNGQPFATKRNRGCPNICLGTRGYNFSFMFLIVPIFSFFIYNILFLFYVLFIYPRRTISRVASLQWISKNRTSWLNLLTKPPNKPPN